MSATTTTEQPIIVNQLKEEDVSKVFIRPKFLTLEGLYSTTKNLYSTYVPASAAKIIGGVSQTLFKVSSPFVVKVIPEKISADWKCLETGDVENLDKLVASYFTAGDETIDMFLNQSSDYVADIYTTHKSKITAKVDSWVDSVFMWKNFLVEKVQGVKPEVSNKIDEAKAAVQAKLEDEKVVAIMDQAKPYINLVKENVEPAKDILTEMATSAKAEMNEKGYMGYAKESADSIRVQGREAIETCKNLGPVEGVKELSNQVMSSVVTKLEDAKKKRSPSTEGEVEALVGGEEYSSADDEAH